MEFNGFPLKTVFLSLKKVSDLLSTRVVDVKNSENDRLGTGLNTTSSDDLLDYSSIEIPKLKITKYEFL